MINPNELRIGNYIRQVNDVQDIMVYGVHYDRVYYSLTASMHAQNYKGIPLTHEWLRKFGFITLDAEADIEVWGLDDNLDGEEFSLVSDGLDSPLPLYFEYDLGYREVRKEIKFVHQLQNLYHSLTGEELTIKETV